MVKIPVIDVREERDPEFHTVVMWLRESGDSYLSMYEAVKSALVSRFLITTLVSEGASSDEILRHIAGVRTALHIQLDELNRVESRLTQQPVQAIQGTPFAQGIEPLFSAKEINELFLTEEGGNAQEDTF